MTDETDQIVYWNEVAGPKWVANQVRLDRMMSPLTEALLATASPQTGERAIDVGCGCGDLSLRLADAIGPRGHVLAVDLSQPMLAHARARAAAAAAASRRARLDWVHADAAAYPFEPTSDLLTSRFGVMFFADRAQAFANLRRSLKPGGRVAFLTWRRRAEVEWMQAPLDWIAPVLPPPDAADGAVGPFAMADAEATCAMLAAAGFADVGAERVDCALRIGDGVDDALAMLCDTGPAARHLRDAEPQARAEAEALLRAHLESRRHAGGQVEMAAACWLYAGRV